MKTEQPTRAWTTVLMGILALAMAIPMLGCEPGKAEPIDARPPRPVKAIQLKAYAMEGLLSLPGTAKAKREVDISFRVGGPLYTLKAETGQFVAKGDVVARIDSRDFSLQVKTMKASLAASLATLEEAELQFNRYRGLMEENAAAKATYDRVRAAFEVAQARVDADRQGLANTENALRDTTLRAPFSGFIHQEYVENHETVVQGQPIVSLVDLSQMEVELALPAISLPKQKKFSGYTCSFDALPGLTFQALYKEIAKQPNRSNASYPLTLTLVHTGESPLPIRPGMSGEVAITLEGDGAPRSYLVPPGAVANAPDRQSYVYVLNSEHDRVKKTPVALGELTQLGVEIVGAVEEGKWIVTAGLGSLQDGQEVRLLSLPSSSNVGEEL